MKIVFVCRYPDAITLTTDKINVKSSDKTAEGKLTKTGSWSKALSMNFIDENSEALPQSFVVKLGSIVRVSVAWSVYSSQD